MRPRRSDPLRPLRRLRFRAARWARPLCRMLVLLWFSITSLGIPLAQASPQDADSDARGASAIDAQRLMSAAGNEGEQVVPEDELCVLPELLAPPKPLGHCGCSLSLQAAGRCCCASENAPAAKSCCAKKPAPGIAEAIVAHDTDQDRPADRFACLTCPCGSGSDAWITVAAEPRILVGAVVLAPGGVPVAHLVAITPHLPQVFLSPDAPPPRPAD